MKKIMVYILALSMAFSALLTGCGEKKNDRPTTTSAPEATILPEEMMPNVEDGIVNDNDGILTEADNGPVVDTDQPIQAGPNDMEGNVSADPDVNAAVNADRNTVENGKTIRP